MGIKIIINKKRIQETDKDEPQHFNNEQFVEFFMGIMRPLGFSFTEVEQLNSLWIDFKYTKGAYHLLDNCENIAEDIQTALLDKGIKTKNTFDPSIKFNSNEPFSFFNISGQINGIPFDITAHYAIDKHERSAPARITTMVGIHYEQH